MRFIDEVDIHIASGHGGPGSVAFRREKFVPKGGPSGGNGGRGGHVFIKADRNLNTLLKDRGQRIYRAPDGEPGARWTMDGHAGEDIILKVPVGTLVRDKNSGDVLCDIGHEDDEICIAQGGKGGMGNTFFKTSTNQTPRFAQDGLPGVEMDLVLELKLLADVSLVGLPNAGKSTLISSISDAKPKIADYPFTTLEPNLGVVEVDEATLVVADIPGLIEDASIGKGLGIKFLKHIERSNVLVHLVDCSMLINVYEAWESYATVRKEILEFSQKLASKKEIVCLTKIDAMSEEEIKEFQDYFEETLERKVLPISGVSGRNIETLKRLMLRAKAAEETTLDQ